MATVFLSPTIQQTERDFTSTSSSIGVTKLGLVGETMKGPAFEPITVRGLDDFRLRFGRSHPRFSLPYVANSFLAQSNQLTITRILGQTGFDNSPAWIIAGDHPGSDDSKSILAIIRSKRNNISGNFYLNENTDLEIGNTTGGVLSNFVISGSTGPLTGAPNGGYSVTLDETKEDYIINSLGRDPILNNSEEPKIYVEEIYPHFTREASARGDITGLTSYRIFTDNSAYTDYKDSYKDSVTPYVVSRVRGGETKDLFRIRTISDGDASAEEIKISIQNIDINNNNFDLLVRRFDDTDANATRTALESFNNLSLDETSSRYFARMIGTTDETYPRNSNFITVEPVEGHPQNTVPGGFKGYTVRETGVSGTTFPEMFYKEQYFSGDSIFRTYLGISELAYTSFTTNNVSVQNSIKTVEKDIFKYHGAVGSGTTTTKGFHLESKADQNKFKVGKHDSMTGYTNEAGTLVDKNKLKFTFVPAGGFDGWDKYQDYQYRYEKFTQAYPKNVESFKKGIDNFAKPEETDINLFATPGIDFSNNTDIVKYALSTIEDRADSLYIIDSPRVTRGTVKGTPEQVVSALESTGIDSNYAATYWPWVQIRDSNTGIFTFQPPTFMAVRAMAFTDNNNNQWWAPAGLTRGSAPEQVRQVDVKLDKQGRDVLYPGRVNPIASFVQQGINIWGQKTLQVESTALDRINIRRLLLHVRRLIADISMTLLFDQNDEELRDEFLSKVQPILTRIQNRRGLEEFNVALEEPQGGEDRNVLRGKIQLKPIDALEFVDMEFQVLPTGASFDDF